MREETDVASSTENSPCSPSPTPAHKNILRAREGLGDHARTNTLSILTSAPKGAANLRSNLQRVKTRPLIIFALISLFALASSFAFSQTQDEVKAAIEQVNQGKADEVRKSLPDLVAKYQNTAGIMYLQGRLATDGIEAVKFYQSVVDNFPKSEWADDALYRIYQYYYSLGLYRSAELKMEQLKHDYPNSPYATGKGIAKESPEQEEPPVKLPSKDTVADEQTTTPPVDTSAEVTEQPKSDTIEIKPKVTQPQVTPPQIAKSNETEPAPITTAPATTQSPYVLQVGAFSSSANAEKQKNFFEDLGYTVEVTNKIRSGKSLYLVWIGSYQNSEEARRAGRELKTKYKIDSMIVERY